MIRKFVHQWALFAVEHGHYEDSPEDPPAVHGMNMSWTLEVFANRLHFSSIYGSLCIPINPEEESFLWVALTDVCHREFGEPMMARWQH